MGENNNTSSLNVTGSESNGEIAGECVNRYTGTHCLHSLISFATCEVTGDDSVYISNNVLDQISAEDSIEQLLFSLETFIKPSDECRSAVIPFLCLYTFGVCGVNNDDYRPTVAQCMEIRDSICESEWKKAADLLALTGETPLPDCSSLREQGLECDNGMWMKRFACIMHLENAASNPLSDVSINDTVCTIECHDHFYCENNFCKPRCDKFRLYSDEYVLISDGIMMTAGYIGVFCAIAVLVTFFIRRKTL